MGSTARVEYQRVPRGLAWRRPATASRRHAETERPSSAVPSLRRRDAMNPEQEAAEAAFLTRGKGVRQRRHLSAKHEVFAATPAAIDFGPVALGQELKRTVTLQNLSHTTSRFTISGLDQRTLVAQPVGESNRVAAGMTAKIEIVFKPSAAGSVKEELVILAGASKRFAIPIAASVDQSLGVVPDETMCSTTAAFLHRVPRMPGTLFNWQTEELVFEDVNEIVLDPALSLQNIRAIAAQQDVERLAAPTPPFCARLWGKERDEDQSSTKQLLMAGATPPALLVRDGPGGASLPAPQSKALEPYKTDLDAGISQLIENEALALSLATLDAPSFASLDSDVSTRGEAGAIQELQTTPDQFLPARFTRLAHAN